MYGILTVILQLQSKILYIKLFIEKIKYYCLIFLDIWLGKYLAVKLVTYQWHCSLQSYIFSLSLVSLFKEKTVAKYY